MRARDPRGCVPADDQIAQAGSAVFTGRAAQVQIAALEDDVGAGDAVEGAARHAHIRCQGQDGAAVVSVAPWPAIVASSAVSLEEEWQTVEVFRWQ